MDTVDDMGTLHSKFVDVVLISNPQGFEGNDETVSTASPRELRSMSCIALPMQSST